jgi:hypothetical protein
MQPISDDNLNTVSERVRNMKKVMGCLTLHTKDQEATYTESHVENMIKMHVGKDKNCDHQTANQEAVKIHSTQLDVLYAAEEQLKETPKAFESDSSSKEWSWASSGDSANTDTDSQDGQVFPIAEILQHDRKTEQYFVRWEDQSTTWISYAMVTDLELRLQYDKEKGCHTCPTSEDQQIQLLNADTEESEIKSIKGKMITMPSKVTHYHVEFVDGECKWFEEVNLNNAKDLIEEYEVSIKLGEGSQIQVYWQANGAEAATWHPGIITDIDGNALTCTYADGDKIQYSLDDPEFVWVPCAQESSDYMKHDNASSTMLAICDPKSDQHIAQPLSTELCNNIIALKGEEQQLGMLMDDAYINGHTLSLFMAIYKNYPFFARIFGLASDASRDEIIDACNKRYWQKFNETEKTKEFVVSCAYVDEMRNKQHIEDDLNAIFDSGSSSDGSSNDKEDSDKNSSDGSSNKSFEPDENELDDDDVERTYSKSLTLFETHTNKRSRGFLETQKI